MSSTVHFRFYGSLNDFLSSAKAGTVVAYTFYDTPSVKDAIEALGIPHPEVKEILVHQTSVDFDYLLQDGDCIAVYPLKHATGVAENGVIKFVLDVHLGKLAKALRMLGFDTLYENNYDDKTIAAIAAKEKRTVLTRDVGLLKYKVIQSGYWLRSQKLEEQLKEVIERFGLKKWYAPMSRCLVCNNIIRSVDKESVLHQLPPKTRLYFHDFYQCSGCGRVYWKGSHFERMEAFINHLVAS